MGRHMIYADADKFLDDPKQANLIYNVIMNVLEGGYKNSKKKIRVELAEILNDQYFSKKGKRISMNQISGIVHRLVVEHQAPIGSSTSGYYIIDDTADQEAAMNYLLSPRGHKNPNEKLKKNQHAKYEAIRKMHFPMATPSKQKNYHQWRGNIKDAKTKYGGASKTKQDVVINMNKGDNKGVFSEDFQQIYGIFRSLFQQVTELKKKVNNKINTQMKFSNNMDSLSVFLNITPELVSYINHVIPKKSDDVPITCNSLTNKLNDSIFFKGMVFITNEAVRSLIWLLIVNHKMPIGSSIEGYFIIEYDDEKQEAIEFLKKMGSGDTQRTQSLEKMQFPKRNKLSTILKQKRSNLKLRKD